jgi:hypothetical protein
MENYHGCREQSRVFRAAIGQMTTGTISHSDSLKGWFVMMKDSKGRYAANELVWGDGWGWSWFDAGNPSTNSPFASPPGRRRGSVARLSRELQELPSAGRSDRLDLR